MNAAQSIRKDCDKVIQVMFRTEVSNETVIWWYRDARRVLGYKIDTSVPMDRDAAVAMAFNLVIQ